MSAYLSKSDFKVARDCPTKLYYKKKRYPSELDNDEYMRLLAKGGYMIEEIARQLYPGGRSIDYFGGHDAAARITADVLSEDAVVLYEATLISAGKLVRVDILNKGGDNSELIEVKAKSWDSAENDERLANGQPNLFRHKKHPERIVEDWRPYLEDVTFQVMVLRELYPEADISPYLFMPDKSKTTSINLLHKHFRLRRITHDYGFESYEVDFMGDVNRLREDHFLTLVDVSEEVELLMPDVRAAVREFVASVRPELTKIEVPLSVACKTCEYRVDNGESGFRECWGRLADPDPHLLDLYKVGVLGGRGGVTASRLIQDRRTSLFDLAVSDLVKTNGDVGRDNERQLIQLRHSRSGTEWFSEELSGILASFEYPLHFIDFETSSLAIPYHAGMRPYETVAFQWSCHTIYAPGERPVHSEWINTDDVFPNFEFAETLMRQIAGPGTVFQWATHENTVLRDTRQQMIIRGYDNPELANWLEEFVKMTPDDHGQLIDMNRLCLRHYFHPRMKGKTSIKNVVDAIWSENARLRSTFPEYLSYGDGGEIRSPYDALEPLMINGREVVVAEGTGAVRAYEAMMYGVEKDDEESRRRWRELLLRYCKLDTAAMVMVWEHWSNADL